MPRIFDNIEQQLLPALQETVQLATRADFCVGLLQPARLARAGAPWWSRGPAAQVMPVACWWACSGCPKTSCASALSLTDDAEAMDNQTALRLKKKLAEEFRQQLMIGVPTNEDEAGAAPAGGPNPGQEGGRQAVPAPPAARQALPALPPRPDQPHHRLSGQQQPHLGRAVEAGRAERRCARPRRRAEAGRWFEDRWNDRWCLDISEELVQIIEESWAREELIPPYHIYLKMAYHLSQEARAGLTEFRIPADFGNQLFEFQTPRSRSPRITSTSAAAC